MPMGDYFKYVSTLKLGPYLSGEWLEMVRNTHPEVKELKISKLSALSLGEDNSGDRNAHLYSCYVRGKVGPGSQGKLSKGRYRWH